MRLGGRYTRIEHDIERLSGGVPGNNNESWDDFLWSAGLLSPLSDRIPVNTDAGPERPQPLADPFFLLSLS